MEIALRYEIENNITELANAVYPTNAPEGVIKPYLVYVRINTNKIKTLNGYTNKQALSYMLSIMHPSYIGMKTIAEKVEALLISFPNTSIGLNKNIYVEDLVINNISETWEPELSVNRGIIDFTIYY